MEAFWICSETQDPGVGKVELFMGHHAIREALFDLSHWRVHQWQPHLGQKSMEPHKAADRTPWYFFLVLARRLAIANLIVTLSLGEVS